METIGSESERSSDMNDDESTATASSAHKSSDKDNIGENEITTETHEMTTEGIIEFKEEPVPIYECTNKNQMDISQFLEESEESEYRYDDDVVMSFTRFAIPFNATVQSVIKRQDDAISGDIPFNETVSTS